MSADTATFAHPLANPRPQNPLQTATLALVKRLLQVEVPAAYPASPSPADHEGVANLIREVASIADEWLAAIGSEVRDNAVTAIDANLFSGSFLGAVDGNETWAAEMQGEALRGYAAERRSERRTPELERV
jgi:hypothetical protein